MRVTPLRAFSTVVLANYVAQVPYAVDLYGTHLNWLGVLLLAATLAWFAIGAWLYGTGGRLGYPLLLAFVAAQVLFYLHSLLLSFAGGGLLYQLTHARDPIVWLAFFIGDLNLVAALLFGAYLVTHRPPSVQARS